MDAADVVMTRGWVNGPFMETPKFAEVSVEDMIVMVVDVVEPRYVMHPPVALNVAEEVSDTVLLMTVVAKYRLNCVAFRSPPAAMTLCEPLVWTPEKTKLLPALVKVPPVAMLIVDVPLVNAVMKLALEAASVPVLCDTVDPVPDTTKVTDPVVATTLTFATGEVRVLAP